MITILFSGPADSEKTELYEATRRSCAELGLRVEVVDGDTLPPHIDPLPDVLIMTSNSDNLSRFCEAVVSGKLEVAPSEVAPHPDTTRVRQMMNQANALIEQCTVAEHALRTMLVAVTPTEPEQFPGHHKAFLDTVAIPRAQAALAVLAPSGVGP